MPIRLRAVKLMKNWALIPISGIRRSRVVEPRRLNRTPVALPRTIRSADRISDGGGVEGESEGITVVERLLAELAADVDQGRIATESYRLWSCATPAAARPLRLGYFSSSAFRATGKVMAVRGAELTYGARRVSRGRFKSGVTQLSSRNIWVVVPGLRLRYSHKRSGRAAPQRPPGLAQCLLAGPWTRPEGRARRPFASQASTSKSALSPARHRSNSIYHRARLSAAD